MQWEIFDPIHQLFRLADSGDQLEVPDAVPDGLLQLVSVDHARK